MTENTANLVVPKQRTDDWMEHIEQQLAFVGSTQTGVILLGDISGYTSLLTETELVHAQGILQFLFDNIYQATGERFLVNEIEGDAIFAYCVDPKDPTALLGETMKQIKEYGHAFYHARADMLDRRAVDLKACPCNACSNINNLSFKFIIHYGEFGVNKVGPFVKLVGPSIVLAHRLLKNDVPSHEYVLLTENALNYLPLASKDSFVRSTEHVEHFGDVPVGYRIFDWRAEDQKHHTAAVAE